MLFSDPRDVISQKDLDALSGGLGGEIAYMIQSVSNVMSGFLVSFIENWKITLVMMASAPVLGIVQGVADKVKLSPLTLKNKIFSLQFHDEIPSGSSFCANTSKCSLMPCPDFPFAFNIASRNSEVKNHILRYC